MTVLFIISGIINIIMIVSNASLNAQITELQDGICVQHESTIRGLSNENKQLREQQAGVENNNHKSVSADMEHFIIGWHTAIRGEEYQAKRERLIGYATDDLIQRLVPALDGSEHLDCEVKVNRIYYYPITETTASIMADCTLIVTTTIAIPVEVELGVDAVFQDGHWIAESIAFQRTVKSDSSFTD